MTRLSLENVNYISPKGVGCRLSGEITSGAFDTGFPSGRTSEIDNLVITLDVPASVAEANEGPSAFTLKVAAELVAFFESDKALSHSLRDPHVTIDGAATSLMPAILVIGRTMPFMPSRKVVAGRMDAWNVMSLLRADIKMDFGSIQSVSAAVIPTEVTANFRRVGLSIISSALVADLKLRAGDLTGQMITDHIGLGRTSSNFKIEMNLHSRDDLMRADREEDGFSPWPDARLSKFEFRWSDEGFDGVFADLMGLPPGTWVDRPDDVTMKNVTPQINDSTKPLIDLTSTYKSSIALFFSDARIMDEVGFTLNPAGPAWLPGMFEAMVTKPEQFFQIMRPERILP